MAKADSLKYHVAEITTCPICLEDFGDPKSLPCLHTFCMRCIDGHCRGTSPGSQVPCPVCRTEFRMPPTGVNGLQHNFFIQGLIEAKAAASAEPTDEKCEVCLAENDPSEDVPSATSYCVDCSQKLCEQCSRPHRRWRGGAHEVQQLGDEQPRSADLIRQRGNYCERHRDKPIELYCFSCRVNICMMCFIIEHKDHPCHDINKVAEDFLNQGCADFRPVLERADELKGEALRIGTRKDKILAAIDAFDAAIDERGEAVISAVRRQMAEQKEELQNIKSATLKNLQSVDEKIEMGLMAIDSFNAFFSELKTKGKPSDITRMYASLQTRASELLKTFAVPVECSLPRVFLAPSKMDKLVKAGESFVGRVGVKALKEVPSLSTLHLHSLSITELEPQLASPNIQQQLNEPSEVQLQQLAKPSDEPNDKPKKQATGKMKAEADGAKAAKKTPKKRPTKPKQSLGGDAATQQQVASAGKGSERKVKPEVTASVQATASQQQQLTLSGMKPQTETKPHVCDDCQKTFSAQAALEQHRKDKHIVNTCQTN